MAQYMIVARPYARAVFEIARSADSMADWAEFLALASGVVDDDSFRAALHSPDVEPEQLTEMVIDICSERAGELQGNFIRLLGQNGHLHCLPAIAQEFVRLRDEHENIADVEVVSAVPLSEDQEERFAAAMRSRLGKEVRIHCQVDSSLIGGAIVRAGDMVIDGSLRGRLDQLASAVTH